MKKFIYILLIIVFATVAHGATYNYYFSNNATGNPQGSDSNDCSQSTPCQSFNKIQSLINAATSADIVNIFLDRTDVWVFDTDRTSNPLTTYGITIPANGPVVHMDAYGSGTIPEMNGTVTDFSVAPQHNASTGPYFWNHIIRLSKSNCSFKNLRFNELYGQAFLVPQDDIADNILIEACEFTNLGYLAVYFGVANCTQNSVMTRNLVHTTAQLCLFGKSTDPCVPVGGFSVCGWCKPDENCTPSTTRTAANNLYSYNVMYDIYGEALHGHGYTAEYNLIGDTASAAIIANPCYIDGADVTIRYNFIISSTNSEYYTNPGSAHVGIGIWKECQGGGDNTNADVQVYGNVVINRRQGMRLVDYDSVEIKPWRSVRIYNNTFIDSKASNIYMTNYNIVLPGNGYIYNNVSILYDQNEKTTNCFNTSGGACHVSDEGNPPDLASYWTIDNNAYWTTGGNPQVDPDWISNYITQNPLLYGEEKEPKVNWQGQTGPTYPADITFEDVQPTSLSSLIDGANNYGFPFSTEFLRDPTNWTMDPFSSVWSIASKSPIDLGAIISVFAEPDLPIHRSEGVSSQ